MTEIGRYRTADGGLAAYDKNGLTWRIPDQNQEEAAGLQVPLVATSAPLVHEVTTPLPETEWTGGEDDTIDRAPIDHGEYLHEPAEETPVDPFAGLEEGE